MMPSGSLKRIIAYVHLSRPYNARAALIAYVAGAAFSGELVLRQFLYGAAIVLLTRLTITVWNDIRDVDVDRANGRKSGLLDGTISQEAAVWFTVTLGIAALAFAAASSRPVAGILYLLVYFLLTWLYNDRPFQASRRPVASIALLGFLYGALPLLFGAFFAGRGNPVPLVALLTLAAAWFLQRCSISLMKDYKDAPGDKKSGKHTFYLHYGAELTAILTLGLWLAGCSLILATLIRLPHRNTHAIAATGLLLALYVFAFLQRYGLLGAANDAERNRIFRRSYNWQLLCEAAVAACLFL